MQRGLVVPVAAAAIVVQRTANRPEGDPPKPPRDQQIVAAALELIQHDGADSLSMRKLAQKLGVTPMAIYNHVPNKDALFDRISDAVLSRVPRHAPSGTRWRQELTAYAVQGWQLLLEYPGLSTQIANRPPSAQSDELNRYGVSILIAAGFEPPTAALAIASYHAFMVGVIGLQAQLELRSPNRKRRTSSSTAYLRQLDFRRLVDFGVESILSGLEQRLRSQQRAPAPKSSRRRAVATDVRS